MVTVTGAYGQRRNRNYAIHAGLIPISTFRYLFIPEK